jgi:spermidine/putrescine transport system substrate-binding protein
MTVTKRARNPEGAHAFMNAILDPATGAKLSAFTLYATPNAKAKMLLPESTTSDRAIYPDDTTMSRLEYIADVGEATTRYDATWTSVKAK